MNDQSNINNSLNSIKIYPSKVNGVVSIPSSKSLAHRAIICAGLSKGESIIDNVYFSKDIMVTIQAMESLGADIKIVGNKLIVNGIKDFKSVKYTEINVFESASTLRFLIPILSLFDYEFTIKGSKSLFSRPLEIYEELYNTSGCKFERCEDYLKIKGKLTRKSYVIEGNISSQFVSGLLFMLPLLDIDTTLVVNNLESRNYVFLTLDVMKQFGISVGFGKTFYITGKQRYTPTQYSIEGDYTQLANFIVLGTINNDITVKGLNIDTLQGDAMLPNMLKNVKYIEDKEPLYKIFKYDYTDLVFDITDTPDLGPILMILLSLSGGVIKNVQRLKYKESNRIEAMVSELRKFGVDIILVNNNIYIKKKDIIEVDTIIDSHNDHRICMALTCLATIATSPVIIKDFECIKKSYPTFLDDLEYIGVRIEKMK